MAREDDIKLKDMLRAIEAGEIEEDLDLPDPEEYDDMGGIKSLDKGAPSIKLAYETGPEEFELELMSVIREFNDLKEKGLIGPDVTVDEYINDYLSKKKMKMEQDRQMAMYGGRMQYGDGMRPIPDELLAIIKGLKSKVDPFIKEAVTLEALGKKFIKGLKSKVDPFIKEAVTLEALGKKFKGEDKIPERLKSKVDPFIKEAVTLEALGKKFKGEDKIPERQSRMEKDYPDAIKKKYNFMDLIDKEAEDEYYKIKEEQLDRKYNPQNYPPSQRNMSIEQIKKMLKKAKEDKLKRAKGGIAGVL
jgi:hypothetical protein